MPLNGTRLSGEEVGLIRNWINGMGRPYNQPRSNEQILDVIAQDNDRIFFSDPDPAQTEADQFRYISMAHFADEGRTADEIKATEGVLQLVINSLSNRPQLVKLQAVDMARTIFRFNLTDLGLTKADWENLVSFYPYCIRSNQFNHSILYERLRTEAPYVRADWLMATATKSPIYEQLLRIPNNVNDLAQDLGVDIAGNINHIGQAEPEDVVRIGFRSSGVSSQNRIIERHSRGNNAALWISYDFASNDGRSDIRNNPLGPDAIDQRNFNRTFIQAGGEVIYTLDNGLQGYLLVNAVGDRHQRGAQGHRARPATAGRRGGERHLLHQLPRSRGHDPGPRVRRDLSLRRDERQSVLGGRAPGDPGALSTRGG